MNPHISWSQNQMKNGRRRSSDFFARFLVSKFRFKAWIDNKSTNKSSALEVAVSKNIENCSILSSLPNVNYSFRSHMFCSQAAHPHIRQSEQTRQERPQRNIWARWFSRKIVFTNMFLRAVKCVSCKISERTKTEIGDQDSFDVPSVPSFIDSVSLSPHTCSCTLLMWWYNIGENKQRDLDLCILTILYWFIGKWRLTICHSTPVTSVWG